MPKVTEANIGRVRLLEIEPGKWRAAWMDPLTKRYIRRVLPAATYKEAVKQVQTINETLAANRGFGGRLRGGVGHSVSHAVVEAIKHTNANEKTRLEYSRRFNPFSDYLKENAQGVQSWRDVSGQVLQNYLEFCRRSNLAHDTIRQRLHVLRLTSDYMSATYPEQYKEVTRGLKLRRHDPTAADLGAKDAVLNMEQMKDLLKWLYDNKRMIYTWAVLQGLCGLRLQEAAYLRESDIDFKEKTIRIAESSAHKPKNRPSYRIIPVCQTAIEALAQWIPTLKVRHNEGYLFMPTKAIGGRRGAKSAAARVGALSVDSISHFWKDALLAAILAEVKVSKDFIPRKMRASFVTAMRQAGADFPLLQAYIGHAPSSILSASYDQVDLERLRVIADLSENVYQNAKKEDKKIAKLQ